MSIISTDKAALAVGPYSQAVVHNGVVYCSGCIGLKTGETVEMVTGGVVAEAAQAFDNMEAILKASGSSLGQVLKVNIFLKKMSDFAEVNVLYQQRFGDHKPARACVAVAELPKGMETAFFFLCRFEQHHTHAHAHTHTRRCSVRDGLHRRRLCLN